MRMPRERQELILRQLRLKGSVRATELQELLGVSEVTVRRDLQHLADSGLLDRVHGGAVLHAGEPGKASRGRPVVGIVVPSRTVYFPEVIRGAEHSAEQLGVRLVLSVSAYDHEEERSGVDRVLKAGASALLLTPARGPEGAADIGAWLDTLPVPVVLMERVIPAAHMVRNVDSVRTDHAEGAVRAVRHLVRLGHHRVALGAYAATSTAFWLRRGYREAVEVLGLDPRAPVVDLPPGTADPRRVNEAIEHLLAECRRTRTRAALVHTDHHAARLVEAAVAAGLRVPEDLAVIAYDDELAALGPIPLSAVAPPKFELGELAMLTLAQRLRTDQAIHVAPRQISLMPRLVIRESCGGQ